MEIHFIVKFLPSVRTTSSICLFIFMMPVSSLKCLVHNTGDGCLFLFLYIFLPIGILGADKEPDEE